MASTPGGTVERLVTSVEPRVVTSPAGIEATGDANLVEAARCGDRSAFGQLYDRYARMVHGILLARVPLHEVDDLVQDVFLLALPRLHTLRDVSRFGPWLAAIARNRANDYYRQSVDQVELTEELSAGQAGKEGPGDLGHAEAARILAMIRTLPEAYREPLLLRLVEGMTGPEISERTGMTPGSVRVNLHRGMQQLREKLAERKSG